MKFKLPVSILLLLMLVAFANKLAGQKTVAFGPAAGLTYTKYGDTPLFLIEIDGGVAPVFGASLLVGRQQLRLRTDLFYQQYTLEGEEIREINAALSTRRNASVSQSGLLFFGGGEYHFQPDGFTPFVGAGVSYNLLFSYDYELITTRTYSTSGNTVQTIAGDQDPQGGEYGVYVSGGASFNRFSLEFRGLFGNRNRSDISIPISKVSLLVNYWL